MIRSMTGYSAVRIDSGAYSLSLTLKGTNHRYLDVQLRLPAAMEFLDPEIRGLLKDHVHRGHVEVTIALENRSGAALRLDRNLLSGYLKAWQSIRAEFGISAEPDVAALLRMPGVVAGGEETGGEEEIKRLAGQCMSQALAGFNQMRAREGAALEQDFKARLDALDELRATVAELSETVAAALRERIERRVRELLQGAAADPARIAQETALLAMKSDITEELTRFKSHLSQAKRLLAESEEAGKRLDFLLQEMNREANTMLSKTADVPGVGLRVQTAAIEMKAGIEKLREQVQNIE
ncbi:MAG: YicC family protein [Acidobacteriota bacterium]|nr:YicC family protein [Acidobacteriota bacterium]